MNDNDDKNDDVDGDDVINNKDEKEDFLFKL